VTRPRPGIRLGRHLVVTLLLAVAAQAAFSLLHQAGRVAHVVAGGADLSRPGELDRLMAQASPGVAAWSATAWGGLMVVAGWGVAARGRRWSLRRYLGLRLPGRDALLAWGSAGVVLGLLAASLAGAGGARLPVPLPLSPGPVVTWPVVVACVALPVGEEVFLRGLVQQRVRQARFCGWGAALIVAMLGAGIYAQGGPALVGFQAVLGMGAGMARVRTGSVAPGLGLRLAAGLTALAASSLA
jgi:membrane protease YdiL (CAAX protease family)